MCVVCFMGTIGELLNARPQKMLWCKLHPPYTGGGEGGGGSKIQDIFSSKQNQRRLRLYKMGNARFCILTKKGQTSRKIGVKLLDRCGIIFFSIAVWQGRTAYGRSPETPVGCGTAIKTQDRLDGDFTRGYRWKVPVPHVCSLDNSSSRFGSKKERHQGGEQWKK